MGYRLGFVVAKVLRRMGRGEGYSDAKNSTSIELKYKNNTTVHDRCTRALDFTVDEFEMLAYKLIRSPISEVLIKTIEDAKKPGEVKYMFERVRSLPFE